MMRRDLEGAAEGRRRVIIEAVTPEVDGGRFPIKRTVGEEVAVEADVFGDGHDLLCVVLRFRKERESQWTEQWMELMRNDRWRAVFIVRDLGMYQYSIAGWVDRFGSWRRDLEKKFQAGQLVGMELRMGAELAEAAAAHAGEEEQLMRAWAAELRSDQAEAGRVELGLSPALRAMMRKHGERQFATEYGKELGVRVDPVGARFSAWYEVFPRSCGADEWKHGTFADCERWLPRVAQLGFDVLYLPPIHPIGTSFRKGRNNQEQSEAGDVGSPWGIGSEAGGHKSIHPELGSLEDFRRLVSRAREAGIEVALDVALQCSPDHPYVREHPEWFAKRPDGTVQYAENPPKKYQDIYPFNFETERWRELWEELKSIFDFWIEQGVRVFRVDNPHTKPLPFWEWLIGELKEEAPELIFLAEAFTRPKVMYYLAKAGFTQSYNYFPWRNTKWELTQYFTELMHTEVKEYFRPNLWPNTPDILTQFLQYGGRPAFMVRLVLAATLGASYGIYGPAFEVCENRAREFGSEEYLDSEKYQLRHWDLAAARPMEGLIQKMNGIRRAHPALQSDERLVFHLVDNEQLIAYSKSSADGESVILVVANLDPHHAQSGWTHLDLEALGMKAGVSFQAHDLLTESRFLWNGPRNFVQLDPGYLPAHVFQLRRWIRTEHDFDYFM